MITEYEDLRQIVYIDRLFEDKHNSLQGESMKRIWNVFLFTVLTVFLTAGVVIAGPPVLQTQYGAEGIEVDLIRCKVTGNVLTASFLFRPPQGGAKSGVEQNLTPEQIYYIADNKKYQILKDDKGHWLAAPCLQDKRRTPVRLWNKQTKVAWFKFPAPPEGVTTIQLNIDAITPFDDVEVQR